MRIYPVNNLVPELEKIKVNSMRFSRGRIPPVSPIIHEELSRDGVISLLTHTGVYGIELGVAGGHFSARMVQSNIFKHFFGVDLYEDHHDVTEYKSALKLIGRLDRYSLLRMSFDEALDLFDDQSLDFIYIDGYAHTGEEGGSTYSKWWKKLKPGGVFSGDDYHSDWPLVIWAVNEMVSQLGVQLHVTGQVEDTHQNTYPSWFFTKPNNGSFQLPTELLNYGQDLRDATRFVHR